MPLVARAALVYWPTQSRAYRRRTRSLVCVKKPAVAVAVAVLNLAHNACDARCSLLAAPEVVHTAAALACYKRALVHTKRELTYSPPERHRPTVSVAAVR